MSETTTPNGGGSGGETLVAVVGQDWNQIVVRPPARANPVNGSSSTWDLSTRPPTACCG